MPSEYKKIERQRESNNDVTRKNAVMICELPDELLGEVASYLDRPGRVAFVLTSKTIRASPSVRSWLRTLVVDCRSSRGLESTHRRFEDAVRSFPLDEFTIKNLEVRNANGLGSFEFSEDVKRRLSCLNTLTLRNVRIDDCCPWWSRGETTTTTRMQDDVRRLASLFTKTLRSVTLSKFKDVDLAFLRALPDSVQSLHTYNFRNIIVYSPDIGNEGCVVIAERFPKLRSLVYDVVDSVRDVRSEAPVDAMPLAAMRGLTHLSFPRVVRKVIGKPEIIAGNPALRMSDINAASHRDYPELLPKRVVQS